MTERKAESFLQSIRDLKFKIDDMEREIKDIRKNMITIKSSSDYSERVQSSPRQDSLELQAIRIIETMEHKQKLLNEKRELLIAKRGEAREVIRGMKEGQSRRFLMDYYIECKSWQQIFGEYGYSSIETAYHLKKEAIKKFEKYQKELSES